MSRVIIFFLYSILGMSLRNNAHIIDTAGELKNIVRDFKDMNTAYYDYTMDVKFPDGQKDHLKGSVYMNGNERLYYNECDAFTMIYTSQWFYKADHRKKTVTVADMNKEQDKKQKKATEKDIFQNGAVTAFLDSVLLKTATVKAIRKNKDTVGITLEFPQRSVVRRMDIVYDVINHLLVKYDMTVYHQWQKTPKSVQVIETKIRCDGFRKDPDRDLYSEGNFFSCKRGKVELKKYKDYKLFKKF